MSASKGPNRIDLTGRILLAEDDPSVSRLISYILQSEGHDVDLAGNGVVAWEKLQFNTYDLVITDIRMPGMDGMELLGRIRESYETLPVLVLSAFGSTEAAIQALKLGAYDYLKKPLENKRLRAVVQYLIYQQQIGDLDVPPCEEFFGMYGRSDSMRSLLGAIAQIANYRTPILILGEEGSGKKRLAKAIHDSSPVADEPFKAFDCRLAEVEPLEAKLLGRPGTAAERHSGSRHGVFEIARGGTVLLEHLGELSSGNQERLLSIMKSGELHASSGRGEEKNHVRIICTTDQNIRTAVETRTFREDLLYRLRGVVVDMPPLRNRISDIELLIAQFLEASESRLRFADEALECCRRYRWPGNVHELREVVIAAAKQCEGEIVQMDDLPSRVLAARSFDAQVLS